jgi:hypothetical protein
MDVRGVHDFDTGLSAEAERIGEPWHHLARLRGLQRRAVGDEVVLHIDHDQGGAPWIELVDLDYWH